MIARPRLSFRLLALASLALNLFLGGMLVSTYHHQQPVSALPMPDRLIARVTADLPDADVERLRRAFESKRTQFVALDEEYRQAIQRVRATVVHEPLDREELRVLIDSARAVRRRMGDLIEGTALSLLPDLSPSARERLVAGRR